MREINQAVISEFRANGGQLSGPMEGAPILLLTTTGRSSGQPHTTPVGFVDAGGRIAVAAANGGADNNPDWFRNIEANSQVTIELPGAEIPSTATIVAADERPALLDKLVRTLPGMSDHVAATDRPIPVVLFDEA